MVWLRKFFFAHKQRIHHQYKEFYGVEDEDREVSETVEKDTPEIPATEATARFYFQLTYLLSGDKITEYDRVNDLNMYLCLNTASLIKERRLKEQEEIRKIQQKNKQYV